MDTVDNGMSVQDAMVHLHNLTQMFQSPLILLEALKVVEAKTASYAQLAADMDLLVVQHDALIAVHDRVSSEYAALEQAVSELRKVRDNLQAEINATVSRLVAQVKV